MGPAQWGTPSFSATKGKPGRMRPKPIPERRIVTRSTGIRYFRAKRARPAVRAGMSAVARKRSGRPVLLHVGIEKGQGQGGVDGGARRIVVTAPVGPADHAAEVVVAVLQHHAVLVAGRREGVRRHAPLPRVDDRAARIAHVQRAAGRDERHGEPAEGVRAPSCSSIWPTPLMITAPRMRGSRYWRRPPSGVRIQRPALAMAMTLPKEWPATASRSVSSWPGMPAAAAIRSRLPKMKLRSAMRVSVRPPIWSGRRGGWILGESGWSGSTTT